MRARHLTAIAVVATIGSAMALTGCGSDNSKSTSKAALAAATSTATATNGPTINVAGHGKVDGTPDVMTVTMGVQTTDSSAQTALRHNSERAGALIASLKAHGVADKDIQTVDLNVSPTFDDHFHVTGYSASNTVTAKLRDLSKAGAVIDAAAVSAGEDVRLQGVTFSIDDTSALVTKARADAVKDAVAQAKQLAAAAGVTLGPIRTIDDTGTNVPSPVYYSAGTAGDSMASVPVQPGSQQLSVDVTVVFDIVQ
jgi:uncharacterized protein YggE